MTMRLAAIALACALAAAAGPASGQTAVQPDAAAAFPNKPVRLVIPFAPGGGNDILARVLAPKLGASLGQPVVVENRPGAQGIIAVEYVMKSAPDGHTVLVGPSGPMTGNPAIYTKLPYSTLRDFVPVTMIGSIPLILVVNSSLPVRSVQELVAYARARPNGVNYSATAALGVDPSGMPGKEFAGIVAADIARWTAVARAANVKAD